MASRKTVTSDNLIALGPERLAAILVELADGNAEVKQRLRLELAAQTGTPEPCFHKICEKCDPPHRRPGHRSDRKSVPAGVRRQVRCRARCVFISNMVTLSLPKTLLSLSSARISRRFSGFCRLWDLM
jgi:uncharacterized protein DUF6880